jgi:hypothetical protein
MSVAIRGGADACDSERSVGDDLVEQAGTPLELVLHALAFHQERA